MRVQDGRLVGSQREMVGSGRLPRIASERSDIDLLLAAAGALADLVTADVVGPGRLLLEALFTVRLASGRVLSNRSKRDARKKVGKTARAA